MLFVGNVFEFYNFSLFVMFGEQISSAFFPNYSGYVGYVLFSVGFAARPLGGLLFGYIGDVLGRKTSLIFAAITLSLPTALIGLLPGYSCLGTAAPVIVLLCRLLQGISINGEYIAAAILALEKKEVSQTFTSCVLTAANSAGASLALIVSYIILPYKESWRLWFLFGGIGSLIYLWRRFAYIKESDEFAKSNSAGENSPLANLFKRRSASIFIIIGIGAFSNAVSYSVVVNVKDFVSANNANWVRESIRFIMIFLPIFTYPALGILFSKTKPENVMISISLLGLIFTYPAFFMLSNSSKIIILTGGLIITILGGSISGPSKAVYKKMFPIDCRCSGIAVGKGISSFLFGGLSPLLNVWMIKAASFKLVAGYMTICAAISLASLLMAKKKFTGF
ncbi:MAG: MFS transporter [Holosporales bacterium]|nr:MFS transporter [Holosporales bacterium]